jgi:hypothetical protein
MEWVKVEVTTECPTCKQPYTRLEYEELLFAGMVLAMCDKCVGDGTMMMSSQRYDKR